MALPVIDAASGEVNSHALQLLNGYTTRYYPHAVSRMKGKSTATYRRLAFPVLFHGPFTVRVAALAD